MKTIFNGLLFSLLLLPSFLIGQTTVSGVVTEESSLPLPGVNVLVQGTTRGTATDFDGNYQIDVNEGETIVFSYVGYVTQEIIYSGQQTLNVLLKEDAAQLDEVVIVGYGTVKKEDLTGTTDLVTSKDFNKGPIVSAQSLITGKVAGVSVTSNSGAPGEGQSIRIRGVGSLSLTSEPMYVVDGVPISGGVGGARNPLNFLNPNDIESFVVLKDASSTAIYGSRGANGVILITTKKGKDTGFKFNASTQTTMYNVINTVDVLEADQFRDLINTYGTDDQIGLLGNSNTDWQDQIYTFAVGSDHNFSALGNAFGVPMRASVGYSDHDGILKGDNLSRATGSVSFTPSLLDDHLKLELNARGVYTENAFADRGAIGSAILFDPTQSIYDANSPYAGYFAWLNNEGTQNSLAPTNPLALLNLRSDTAEVRRFVGNAKVDYKLHFFPDLTATVNVGLDKSNSNGRIIVSEFMPNASSNWDGSYNKYSNITTSKLFDSYLTYAKSIQDKHNLNVVAGYSYQSFEYDNISYDSEADQLGNRATFIDKSMDVLLSYFGRLNYDYKGKYLLTASLRADASSKLNPDDRWGYFPSAALAWKISDENFMKDSTFNLLKLRVGYGEIANVGDLAPYQFLTRYQGTNDSAQYQFGNSFYQTYRPEPYNPDLRWEVGKSFNLGLDYSLWDGRVSGLVNAYMRETQDMIATALIDPFTNFSNRIDKNIGDMENKGIEFNLDVDAVRNDNLTVSLNYNIAFNDNQITNLPVDQPHGGISTGVGNNVQVHREGEEASSFLVYQQVYDASGKPIEGVFVDRNGDGIINDEDRYIKESPYADILMGLNANVNYKKWDFSVQTRASIGNYMYNDVAASKGIRSGATINAGLLNNIHADYYNSGFTTFVDRTALSDHFIQEASFFKIDNITLGYTLDKALKDTTIRLYGSVQNLLIATEYDGLDPEIAGGIDNNFYPRPRSFVFGVNVDF
ncbi:TonB-dependent receptor [Mangrovimonas sp. AS39]|uniref:SusC/RagA family TonB-linked outer membrane protein n=1 Tax=Mangrovimonas futianensis TaxID=2895523 RepID=UPI001E5D9E08|nr:TonB-dependent receptor [Mangrovimonas futianensis]MCF1190934.1 TonB-dependent receptor [Mangrovimonas futianensis]MCF1194630.1 TonB-dependent receptor [Mangrovimonas futianensis]MCF1420388.1 TonB-dependent receptor [Mangrovimonas futianensis]